ncbi:MAG: polyphosphate kinase 1, partial [Ekhidna sp.]
MKFYDRDLSWLSFNYRVLMEAMDQSVPLLERLRFIAIYSSNLDEFFRVRVSDIRNLIQIDKKKINKEIDFKPKRALSKIQKKVDLQLNEYGKAFGEILSSLKEQNLFIYTNTEEIPHELIGEILHYFKTQVAAYLKPIELEGGHEVFIDNQAIYLALRFKSERESLVKIPTDKTGRFFKGTTKNQLAYVFIDDVIRMHLDLLFPLEEVVECFSVKLNKNADLQIDDEYHGDLVKKIEKQIQKRNLGAPSRFLYDSKISQSFLSSLTEKLSLSEDDLSAGGRYHNMSDLFQISGNDPILEYSKQPTIVKQQLEISRSLFQEIEREDQIFHFPYHSYDYILQFFGEAAIDPEVEEINVTFYRMAKNSVIGEALISAASNGKKVSVF